MSLYSPKHVLFRITASAWWGVLVGRPAEVAPSGFTSRVILVSDESPGPWIVSVITLSNNGLDAFTESHILFVDGPSGTPQSYHVSRRMKQ